MPTQAPSTRVTTLDTPAVLDPPPCPIPQSAEIFAEDADGLAAAQVYDHIAAGLQDPGYRVLQAPMPPELIAALQGRIQSLDQQAFSRAGIGRELGHQLNDRVRADEVRWLSGADPAEAAYLEWIEVLRLGLNRRLFLGLFDYECHFAHYPEGAFYKRHLDAFAGYTNRVVTTVLYLNPRWNPEDGGELLLYPAGSMDTDAPPIVRIAPLAGVMLVFLSEQFPHEVLPTRGDRYSIAGWFRVNNSSSGRVDPPR